MAAAMKKAARKMGADTEGLPHIRAVLVEAAGKGGGCWRTNLRRRSSSRAEGLGDE
jgi:hypothetical protein